MSRQLESLDDEIDEFKQKLEGYQENLPARRSRRRRSLQETSESLSATFTNCIFEVCCIQMNARGTVHVADTRGC